MAGKDKRDLFAKMHLSFIDSGLLAALNKDAGPGAVIALLVLVYHMDEQGVSFPSQELIGKEAGVSRETAGNWIRRLLLFRWNGEPIVSFTKQENERGNLRYVYYVQPRS
ncbi:hypothetical protein, partial [Bartonella sp. CL29QHWL]|uniref:hypothetical protein n=1 Tax=Bartonella sp. CL29QHWL TaxID=3243522 RepID=UPI0035D09D8B